VADLLNRARGQSLTPDEARAVAIDANRPARPSAEQPAAPADEADQDEDLTRQPEPVEDMDQDAYDVFDPGGVRWRL